MAARNDPKPSIHLTPDLYTVYVLQLEPKPRSFYVGSTPDPLRRLRQHNGQLKAGAYRTLRKNFRPWKHLCLIHGFPSNVVALQFEHALQHPYHTKHIERENRVSILKTSGISLHHKLANVRLLLTSTFFKTFHLKVCLLDANARDVWTQNKFGIEVENVWDFLEDILNFLHNNAMEIELRMESFNKIKEQILHCPISCIHCSNPINYLDEQPEKIIQNQDGLDSLFKEGKLPLISILSCECLTLAHLTCWAEKCELTGIIPQRVMCPSCNAFSNWMDMVATATKIRQYMLKDLVK